MRHIEHPAVPEGTRSRAADAAAAGTSVRRKDPVLRLTYNGELLQELTFSGSRLLIGRSEHNDVIIDSEFVSRHHVLLVRHGAATLLMDLNSANGTYVNSWRVANRMLAHEDMIMIGDHGIKFIHEGAPDRATLEGAGFDDTVVRTSMQDMLKESEEEDTTLMPAERKVTAESRDDTR
jgi:pSer/pThr/pTyr-binding forkhead associated (FHA) protein